MGYANGSSHYYASVTFQDFEGQGRAEKLSRIIITLFGTVGLVWGYIIQQFSQTVYILIAGVLLASIVSSTNGILFGKSNILFYNLHLVRPRTAHHSTVANLSQEATELAKAPS